MFSSSRKLSITRIRSSSCKMFLHSELGMPCTLSLELNTHCLTSWLHNNQSFLMVFNTVFEVDICSDLIFSWACCVCFSSKLSACIVDIVSLRIGNSAAHVHGIDTEVVVRRSLWPFVEGFLVLAALISGLSTLQSPSSVTSMMLWMPWASFTTTGSPARVVILRFNSASVPNGKSGVTYFKTLQSVCVTGMMDV